MEACIVDTKQMLMERKVTDMMLDMGVLLGELVGSETQSLPCAKGGAPKGRRDCRHYSTK